MGPVPPPPLPPQYPPGPIQPPPPPGLPFEIQHRHPAPVVRPPPLPPHDWQPPRFRRVNPNPVPGEPHYFVNTSTIYRPGTLMPRGDTEQPDQHDFVADMTHFGARLPYGGNFPPRPASVGTKHIRPQNYEPTTQQHISRASQNSSVDLRRQVKHSETGRPGLGLFADTQATPPLPQAFPGTPPSNPTNPDFVTPPLGKKRAASRAPSASPRRPIPINIAPSQPGFVFGQVDNGGAEESKHRVDDPFNAAPIKSYTSEQRKNMKEKNYLKPPKRLPPGARGALILERRINRPAPIPAPGDVHNLEAFGPIRQDNVVNDRQSIRRGSGRVIQEQRLIDLKERQQQLQRDEAGFKRRVKIAIERAKPTEDQQANWARDDFERRRKSAAESKNVDELMGSLYGARDETMDRNAAARPGETFKEHVKRVSKAATAAQWAKGTLQRHQDRKKRATDWALNSLDPNARKKALAKAFREAIAEKALKK